VDLLVLNGNEAMDENNASYLVSKIPTSPVYLDVLEQDKFGALSLLTPLHGAQPRVLSSHRGRAKGRGEEAQLLFPHTSLLVRIRHSKPLFPRRLRYHHQN
jgi:hypothetical protein